MTTTSIDRWTNFRGSLEGLARQPLVVLALLLLVNAVVLPYRGLHHDARLYAAQVHEHVEPGSMADDLYLRYGSQDRYSIFSVVMVPLARGVGLEWAFFLGYLASKSLFFWALVRLVFALVPERVPALAALVYLAMAPLPFGGNEVIHLNEPFLTPRIASCGMVLLALERALAKRMAISLVLCLLAMTLHPIMAFGGLLVVVTYWALRRLPSRLFAALVGLAVLAGTVAVAVEPLGRRLFGHMDDEWHEVYMQLCFFIDPVAWTLGDWSRTVLAVALVGITAWTSRGEERNFTTALLLAAAAGFAGTLVAVHSRYALLLQVSPYRTIWLTEILAIPLGFRFCWLLIGWSAGIDPTARPAWAKLLAPPTATVIFVLLTTDWNRTLFLAALPLVAVLPLCLVAFRGLGSAPGRPDWGFPVAAWTFGLTAGLLLALDSWAILSVLRLPTGFDLDVYPLHALLVLGEFLFKLPLLLVALALAAWLGRRTRLGWRLTAGLAAAWLIYLGTTTALDASPDYSVRHSVRFAHIKQVADFLELRAARQDRPNCVYWFTDLRDVWYAGRSQSYLNAVQLSGCGYNRGTAVEGRRRARLTAPFEGPALFRQPLSERWWQKAVLHFLGDPDNRPPSEADLLALAADEQLDFAVLEIPFDGLYAASTGRWFIYDCAWLREKVRAEKRSALPAGGGRVSITSEMKPSSNQPGGDDVHHRAANE